MKNNNKVSCSSANIPLRPLRRGTLRRFDTLLWAGNDVVVSLRGENVRGVWS